MNTTTTGVYDFSQTIVLIKHRMYPAQILINGFAEGSNISVSRSDPTYSQKPSGDGKSATLERNPIKAGTITFSLNQSTDSLSKMNAIAQYSEDVASTKVLYEITVIDKSSGSVHYSRDAVSGHPQTVDYGREENAREFVVACGSIYHNIQGAALIPKETVEIVRALGYEIDPARVADY